MKPFRNFILIALFVGILLIREGHAQITTFGNALQNPFGIDPSPWQLEGYRYYMQLGDLDDDGDLDMLVLAKYNDCYYYGMDRLYFCRNTGTPSTPLFELDTIFEADLMKDIYDVDFADVDGDGDLDFIVSGDNNVCGGYIGSYVSPGQFVFFNNSEGGSLSFMTNYQAINQIIFGPIPNSYVMMADGVWEDLNNDDDLDYIGTALYSTGGLFNFLTEDVFLHDMQYFEVDSFYAWWNDSGDSAYCHITGYLGEDSLTQYQYFCGSVDAMQSVLTPSPAWQTNYTTFDLDQDQFPDVFEFAFFIDSIAINLYTNQSETEGPVDLNTAQFYALPPIDLSNYSPTPAFADIDKDGDPDLLYVGPDGTVHFHLNLQASRNIVQGRIFLDESNDGLPQESEPGVPGMTVHVNDGQFVTTSDENGNYRLDLPAGSYILKSEPTSPWQSQPESAEIVFPDEQDSMVMADFAWYPLTEVMDVHLDVVSVGRTRPGFSVRYNLQYGNTGTIAAEGFVQADLDASLEYENAVPPPDMIDNNKLTWNFSQLYPFETRNIRVHTTVSTAAIIGDTLQSVFQADVTNDPTPKNNTVELDEAITGAVDPNDKLVSPAGQTASGNVPQTTERFVYTIRFQNTGTDTAFIVYIIDQIDDDLDLSTFRMRSASHPYEVLIDENRTARWDFPDIELPDSSVNQAGSNGFVQYEIRPEAGLPVGTEFTNSAAIYFDYNAPVSTNTTVNTFAVILHAETREDLEFNLFPNPASSIAVIRFPNPNRSRAVLEVYSMSGRLLSIDETYDGRFEFKKSFLPAGQYIFFLHCGEKSASGKLIFGY